MNATHITSPRVGPILI